MTGKSLKNSKNLVELIHACLPAALHCLSASEGFEFLQPLDWSLPPPELREAAIPRIVELPHETVGIVDQEAVRLLQLGGWRCEELMEFATATPQFAERNHADFDDRADAFSQLVWCYSRLPRVFDQLETIYLAHHFHGHKKFKPFRVRDGDHRPLEWSEEIARKLQDKIGDILGLDEAARGNCEVIHFEMEETGTDPAQASKLLQYVVVYHPGKMKLLRQMKDRRRDLLAFYPALEATLIYDPAENRTMVLADKMATRVALAECFSEIGLGKSLSAEPLEQMSYDLSVFRAPVDLLAPRLPGVLIEQAWVAGMTLSLGHTSHKVAFLMANDSDFWRVLEQEFGATHPLSRTGFLFEVCLSFVVRFDGDASSKPLDLSITPKTCSLWSLRDRQLRACGEEILLALGILQRVEPEGDDVDGQRLFAAVVLLDEPGDTIDGFRLRQMNLTARDLEIRGAIRKRGLAKSILLRREDEDWADPEMCRLEIRSSSRESWAVDPLTQQRIELNEGDLCHYTLQRAWLQERLTKRLAMHAVFGPPPRIRKPGTCLSGILPVWRPGHPDPPGNRPLAGHAGRSHGPGDSETDPGSGGRAHHVRPTLPDIPGVQSRRAHRRVDRRRAGRRSVEPLPNRAGIPPLAGTGQHLGRTSTHPGRPWSHPPRTVARSLGRLPRPSRSPRWKSWSRLGIPVRGGPAARRRCWPIKAARGA